jgi:hypothetical protein
MKKPLNKFSLALWIVVVAYIAGQLWWFYTAAELTREFASRDSIYYLPDSLWKIVQSVITTGGLLSSLGVLIELVDQIRWQLVHKAQ